MIMIVKTPGSQMGSPAVTEEGGEEVLYNRKPGCTLENSK